MSVTPAPNPAEIQGFQFKLFSKLKVFPDDQHLQVINPLSLVTSSSRYGMLFVGCPTGFKVLQVSSIESAQESQGKSRNELTEYPSRDIQLPSQPSHLAVNSDGTLLAVVINVNGTQIIRVYSVVQFLSQTVQVLQEVRGSTTAGCATSGLSWNPGIVNMLAVCFSDGSASVYEFKAGSYSINSIPPEAKSTCMCWSPKGKQIVIGSQNGTLTQYKPELKAVKNIQAPDINQHPVSVVSVQWLSSFQFAAVYKDLTDENQKSGIMLVNTPKNGPVTFVDYEDICYSAASLRSAQFYLEHIQAWNLLLVASANSMEVGVLGSGETEGSWIQWILEDSSRAELPLDKYHQETLPVGMAWNTNSQHKIPVGENQFLPPMPLFCLYSHKGSLCIFLAVNLLPSSTQLCSVAESPADQSGLNLFVASEPTSTPAAAVPATASYSPITTPTSVTPVKQPVPVSAIEEQGTPKGFQLSFVTGATPPVTADQPQSSVTDLSVAGSQSASKTWDLSFDKAKEASVGKPALSTAAGGSLFGGASQGFTFQSNQPAQNTSFAFGAGGGLNFANTTNTMPPSSNLQPFVSSTQLAPATSKAQPLKIPQLPPRVQPQQQQQQQQHQLQQQLQQLEQQQQQLQQHQLQQQQHQQPQQKPPQQKPAQQNTIEKPSEPSPPAQEEIVVEKPEISAEVVHAAMIEEVKHFDSELNELLNSLKENETKTYGSEAQNKLNGDLAVLDDYFGKQMESTKELQNEVRSLKMAGLELVGFVEDSKRRLHQHKKPGFKKLMYSNEIDPMNMRRLDSINKSMFYVENQLQQSNKILDDKWAHNQDLQKPLRSKMFIPPGEELYLTVINQTNILNSQKTKLDKLQNKIKELKQMQSGEPVSSRKRLPKTTADLSKLAESLLRVDLNPTSSSTRSHSSRNTSSTKINPDFTSTTSKSIMDQSKDFNDSTQIPSDMMVRRIPKVITQSPFNMTGKDRASFIAEALVHNHKICNTLVSKTVSNLSPTKSVASETPTMDLSSSKKSEALGVKSVASITNSFKPSSSQTLQSKTLTLDGSKTFDFSPSISFSNQSEMSFFKTPTKQPEPSATKASGSNFETPVSKNQSNRENIGSIGGFSAVSITSTVVEQAAPVESPFAAKFIEKPNTLSSLSGAGVTQEGKSPLTSISNLLEGLTPKPENKTTAAVGQPSTSFMLSTKTEKTPTSSSTNFFGSLKSTTSDTTPFSFATPPKPEGKDNSPSNATSFFKGVNLFAGAKSESKDMGTVSPFSSIANSSSFGNKAGSIFGGSSGTQTIGAGSTFSLEKPLFGSAPVTTTITTTTTTTAAATTNTPTVVSVASTAQETTTLDSTTTNITFGKPSEKTPVSSANEETEKSGLQTNLIFGGGSLPKTTDPGKTNAFAFQQSTGFSFAQPTKESSDKVEGAKLFEVLSPVSSDDSVKTAADEGVFGTSSTVTASPVSFSFTQSLANVAVSTSAATPAQVPPPATTITLQPVTSGSTGFPVMAAPASLSSPQPSTFSSIIATQSDEKVSSTASESSAVSVSSTAESLAVTTQSPSASSISFSNFNFGSNAQPATSDANAKMTLNFNQSGPGLSGSIFGGGSTTITPVQSTSNVFGETPSTTAASKAAAPFSFSISDSLANANTPKSSFFGSKPLFGTPATSQPTSTTGFFASATTTPTTKPETGLFGQATLSPFGQSQTQSAFGGPPTFGQPAGSLFGQSPSSGFGSQSPSVFGSGGTIFGGGTSTDTAANQPSGGLFSSPATTGGIFGDNRSQLSSPVGVGSFSQPTSPSISQTGFGTAFQNKPATFGQPAFGAQSSFGGAPTFGGSPTFGSPNKVFGSPPSAGGFGASTQQSSTFENLANQNTMSFGNLAQQNQSPGFGSTGPMFGAPQQSAQSTPPAFPNTFGGNSFSSWR